MKNFVLFFLIISTLIIAQEKQDNSPKLSGYIRAWHQTDFSTNQGQFLVKMARFAIKGKVNQFAGYKIQVDVAKLGKFNSTTTTLDGIKVLTNASASFSEVLLDAEAYVIPAKNLTVSLGQFKVPFSTDNLRGGAAIDFVNRPLLTNVTPGMRDVGLMASYKVKKEIPLEFQAGVFNGSGQNKLENDKSTNYSFRTSVSPITGFSISANYYGGKASNAELSIYDFGIDYKIGKAFFTGEFGQRNTKLPSKEYSSNAYFVYGTYQFDFTDSFVTAILPALRYENYDPNGDLDNDEISRVTAGVAFQFAKIKYAQFRINYELFDYSDGRDNPNKLYLELQTRF